MLLVHIPRFFALRKYFICTLKIIVKLRHVTKWYQALENDPDDHV